MTDMYDRHFLKTSWLFTYGSSAETAVTHCAFATSNSSWDPAGDFWGGVDQSLADQIGQRLATLMASSGYWSWANYSHLAAVKFAAINKVDGKYLLDARQFAVSPTTSTGSSLNIPPQCGSAISLWTGVYHQRGTRGKGRLFLPACYIKMDSGAPTGNPANQSGAITTARTFLNGCATDFQTVTPGGSGVVAFVMSKHQPSYAVAKVSVGLVADTQQKRRNGLKQAHVWTDL